MFRINPQSGIPIYRQLMEQVRRMISSGQLKPGDELPSVRALAHQHAVNAMTISKTYSLLEAEGLLERQRGKAMMVSRQSAESENKQQRLRRLQGSVEQLAASAKELNLTYNDVSKVLQKTMEQDHD